MKEQFQIYPFYGKAERERANRLFSPQHYHLRKEQPTLCEERKSERRAYCKQRQFLGRNNLGICLRTTYCFSTFYDPNRATGHLYRMSILHTPKASHFQAEGATPHPLLSSRQKPLATTLTLTQEQTQESTIILIFRDSLHRVYYLLPDPHFPKPCPPGII